MYILSVNSISKLSTLCCKLLYIFRQKLRNQVAESHDDEFSHVEDNIFVSRHLISRLVFFFSGLQVIGWYLFIFIINMPPFEFQDELIFHLDEQTRLNGLLKEALTEEKRNNIANVREILRLSELEVYEDQTEITEMADVAKSVAVERMLRTSIEDKIKVIFTRVLIYILCFKINIYLAIHFLVELLIDRFMSLFN